MSTRETVIENIIDVLTDMNDPKPVLVTRQPFDVEKLAITQFPAILVQSGAEERQDISMRARQGIINFNLRVFVRGADLDYKKNLIIERIEESLDADRLRGTNNFSMRTQILTINPVERIEPLGEIAITVQVEYKYPRGTT